MPDTDKLSRLLKLREMRETRCLGKIAQSRARCKKGERALGHAQSAHAQVIDIAEARNRAVLRDFPKERDPATVYARLALIRAEGEAKVGASINRIEERRADLSQSKHVLSSAKQTHTESLAELERIKALLKRVMQDQQHLTDAAEEDEVSDLFNSLNSGRLRDA